MAEYIPLRYRSRAADVTPDADEGDIMAAEAAGLEAVDDVTPVSVTPIDEDDEGQEMTYDDLTDLLEDLDRGPAADGDDE